MSQKPPQLNITYHVEAGCLGAKGEKHLSPFCLFLTEQLNKTHGELCFWDSKTLTDTQHSHFQYYLQQKKLSRQQATIYLKALNTDIRHFEDNIDDFVIDLIDLYLER